MFLTGCFSQSVEEFYAPPKAPDDYLKLDNEINKVLTQGGEYAAPLSGELTQKVQLQDLDGDVQGSRQRFFELGRVRPLDVFPAGVVLVVVAGCAQRYRAGQQQYRDQRGDAPLRDFQR